MRNFSVNKFEDLHIGNIIYKVLTEKKVSKAELARALGKTPVSINSYLKQHSLQARILFNISIALEYDFFEHLSNILNEKDSKTSKNEEILALKQQITDLQKEISIYTNLLKR